LSTKDPESAGTNLVEYGLTERAQHLLKVLVERFIREGQPVGSRTLTRDSGLNLSAATIRNVMADLEDLGFLESPHTSAGRVPTPRAYRVFVNSLITVRSLTADQVKQMERTIDDAPDTDSVLHSASTMLSTLTHMAGIVMVPRQEELVLRQIEFLALTDRRVLVILVVNEREVQNRIIQVDRDFSESELQQIGNFVTAEFGGMKLTQVRELLAAWVQEERAAANLLPDAANLTERAFEGVTDSEDYVLAGETNLLDFEELSDVRKLRMAFRVLSEKREVLDLLDRCLGAQGTQIFIGQESGLTVLNELSVVTAPYASQDQVLGVLGVIGPRRMAYERVIPIVDVTARILGSVLNSGQ
jgi:heat-inducible transcriptional repressor